MTDEAPEPKTYWVTAPSDVLGNVPGSSFETVLDPVQEERLLDGGALSLTKPVDPDEVPAEPEPAVVEAVATEVVSSDDPNVPQEPLAPAKPSGPTPLKK